jgi:homoserine O-acetyltransferase/O-succinyltransferase
MFLKIAAGALAALVFAGSALAQLITEKKVHTLPQYTTVGGKTIKNVRTGYETYGRLNAAGDNAIFVAHFFSGNSHAAGKYKAEDKAAGYWDSVIGPGKPFDTDKYFVVSADTLVNLNAKDPGTTTTGPASVNPDTGKPYGMAFPIVTMRDFVRVQKALADSLGIRKFVAVTGASMGSLQTMEWAAAYPDMVERAIPVLPGGLEANPYLIEMLNTWAAPIVNDPKWNGGDYYGKEEPVRGLAEALKLVTLNARHYGWADKTFGRKWAAAERNPLQDWSNKYAIEDAIDKGSAGRAAASDANSFLYLVRANQLYQVEDANRIRAKVLSIVAKSDLLLYPDYARKMTSALKAQGNHVEEFEIDGDGGHLDGVFLIAKAGDVIRAFLQK